MGNPAIDEARRALRDEGYVVVRAVVGCGDVKRLRAAFGGADPGSTEHVTIDETTPHHGAWDTLLARNPIGAIVAAHLPGGRVTRVHGRNPGRGGGEQGLHADLPPDPGGGIRALTALWMLDEFTATNGATRVVPGTHRRRNGVPRDYAQPGRRHPDEVVVTGAAGDVLLFDAHLWHAGRANADGRARRAAQMTLINPT